MHAEEMQAHLAAAEEHIRKADSRIRLQTDRVERLPSGSDARRKTEDTLKHFRNLKATMKRRHELIREQLRIRNWEERTRISFWPER
jgi:hypothetical protein